MQQTAATPTLPIDLIDVDDRVRTSPGERFQCLVASVRAHGVLQPVLVRREGARYRLIAGELRLRAARQTGLGWVPGRILETDDAEALEFELAENLTRSGMNPIEQAEGFRRLRDQYGMSQTDIAERFGLSDGQISDRIRLLSLPGNVQKAVADRKLAAKAALYLLRLEDYPDLLTIAADVMLQELPPVTRAAKIVDFVLDQTPSSHSKAVVVVRAKAQRNSDRIRMQHTKRNRPPPPKGQVLHEMDPLQALQIVAQAVFDCRCPTSRKAASAMETLGRWVRAVVAGRVS